MKFFLLLSMWVAIGLASNVQNAKTLDALLQDVQNDVSAQKNMDEKRLKAFLKSSSDAKKMLQQARQALKQEKAQTEVLKANFQQNKAQIDALSQTLEKKSEHLKELFGIAKQEMRDFASLMRSSMTSTQFPSRDNALLKSAQQQANPSIADMRLFYERYIQEIIESGKVATYTTSYISKEGKKEESLCTRVGLFSAFNEQGYLRYDDSLQQFIALQRQPNALEYIDAFYHSNELVKPMLIDPTRGVLFSMLKERASVTERIKQAGVIGYIILVLGALTLLFGGYKYVKLHYMARAINRQSRATDIDERNALGRLLNTFEKNRQRDIQTIESKIDSALLKELPSINAGLPMIKLIAAVAPLLGLLGTVTGMIETFQSITLFGTGDPKLMAGGISQALMTTVLGLVVAIPVLFAYNIIHAKAKTIIEVLTQQSAAMVAKHLEMLPNNVDDSKGA